MKVVDGQSHVCSVSSDAGQSNADNANNANNMQGVNVCLCVCSRCYLCVEEEVLCLPVLERLQEQRCNYFPVHRRALQVPVQPAEGKVEPSRLILQPRKSNFGDCVFGRVELTLQIVTT